jgi:predicted acetyltransferase
MNQDIQIQSVSREEKPVLENLMEFYAYEFSQFIETIEVKENGRYGFEGLDHYWTDPNRHPFFIRVSGKLAGVVLVRVIGEDSERLHSIAEFFVMKKYGGKGIGKTAAKRIFDMFPGRWQVTQIEKNYPAQAFWRSLISEYTNGQYEERYDEHRKSVQEFENSNVELRGI